MNVVERILDLMTINNINASKLTKEIPLTNGLITQWKQGKQKPSLEAVNKIANYFNVSLDYLVNGNTPSENISVSGSITGNNNSNNIVSSNQSIETIPIDQQELLDLYNQLDPIKQAEFKGELKGYIKAKNS